MEEKKKLDLYDIVLTRNRGARLHSNGFRWFWILEEAPYCNLT